MVQAQDATPFNTEVQSLADSVGPLPESKAEHFLQQYPIDAIFRELSGPQVGPQVIQNTRNALEKVFNTQYGSVLLPQLVPYAAAVLQSAAAPTLRQLAVHQLARLLQLAASQQAQQQPAGVAPQQQLQELISLLLRALRDEDVGVAAEAERALAELGRPPAAALPALLQQAPAAQELHALAASPDPVLAIRGLTLALRVAAQSPEAGAAVRGAGLLEPLLAQLREARDVLGCTAALQLVREAAEGCDGGMAAAMGEEVMPLLGALMAAGEDVVVQCASLQAGAALLSAALEAGSGPMAVDDAPPAGQPAPYPHPLLSSLKAVLDVGGAEEYPQEVEEAALDAVGTMGLKAAGASAILLDPSRLFADVAYKALGRAPNPAIRIGALHAVAAVAGAERAVGPGGRAAALLEPAAEDALRTAVYDGALASSPTATPADMALELLGQPFLELRVAAYRALSALLARDWMAAAACSHNALLAFLLNPQSESGRQGCEWRYACVVALGGTVRAAAAAAAHGGSSANGVGLYHPAQYHAALAAAAQRVADAVSQGPYGAHRVAPEAHMVATLPARGQ